MLTKQKLSPYEKLQLSGLNFVTMGIQLENPKYTSDLVEKFKKELIGLSLRCDDGYFLKREKEIKVLELPQIDDLQALTNFIVYSPPPNCKEELGEIYKNDDMIVLRISHALADGKYFVGILDHITDKIKTPENPFPVDFQKIFTKELEERHKLPQNYVEELENYTTLKKKLGHIGGPELLDEIIFDVESFQNYDKKTKKCSNLTNSVTVGYSLGLIAFDEMMTGQKSNFYKIGGPTVADMRPQMKTKPTLNTVNLYTHLQVGDIFNSDDSIQKVFNVLRAQLKEPFVNKSKLFDSPDSVINYGPMSNSYFKGFFSPLGMVNLKSPIRDAIIYDRSYLNILENASQIIHYQIVDNRNDRNEFHCFHRYNTNGLSGWQSRLILRSMKHFLQNFDIKMSLREAIDDLKLFQSKFIKI